MTASERQRRRKTRHSDPAPFLLIVAGALFGMLALILIVGVTYVAAIAEKVPPLDKLTPITQGQASQVYYDDGSEIGLLKSTILRQPVSGSQIPAYLREATVSIEDQRFYQHGAIDYLSLARAARIDDHDAARPQPLPGGRQELLLQDQGGGDRRAPRAVPQQGVDPQLLPQHGSVRDGRERTARRPDRRGRAGGLLDPLRPSRQRRRPGPVGAAGRPAA